jgi:hypothetical protein
MEDQVLAGIGLGSSFQVPIMAGQALAKPEDVSSVTAIMLCTYSRGLISWQRLLILV